MARKYWILLGITAVVLAFAIRYLTAGDQTPQGQPPLLFLTPQSLPQFAQEFNRDAKMERVVLLMSPTCPVCLEGSSKVEAVLKRNSGSNVRVFAVWEPMLPTDWRRPGTGVLARLSDPRVIQVWDSKHLIARLMETGAAGRQPSCCTRNGSWWDVIASYSRNAKWTNAAPAPVLLDGTVESTAPRLEAELTGHPQPHTGG